MAIDTIILQDIVNAGIAVMAGCHDGVTPCFYYLFSLNAIAFTPVVSPRLTNSGSAAAGVTAIIMPTVGMHFNNTITGFVYKIPELFSCTSQPYQVTGILNGNRALDFLALVYFYLSRSDKFIVELNGMKGLNRAFFPS